MEIQHVKGLVVQEPWEAEGTAIQLLAEDNQKYLMRREGVNPFKPDDVLQPYVDKFIECECVVHGKNLLLIAVREVFPKGFDPVYVKTIDDLMPLVEVMRNLCVKNAHVCKGYKASETVEQALEIAKKVSQEGSDGGVRILFMPHKENPLEKLVTIGFTLREENKDGKEILEWNLSLSHPHGNDPQRVNDETAKMITDAFLGPCTEVPSKAIWKTIRHFIREI